MGLGSVNRGSSTRWRGQRGLSTAMAAVVMIVVIVVVGAGAYFAFQSAGGGGGTTSKTTCSPASSPVCQASAATHDIALTVPFASAQAGTSVPFTASLPSGESASSFTFNYGDGSTAVAQSSNIGNHIYGNPGTFIVSVTAVVSGATHDNIHSLVILNVAASAVLNPTGEKPSVAGVVLSNTSSTSGATAILQSGESVTFSGSYSSAPTNPLFTLGAPTFAATGGLSPSATPAGTNTSLSATYAPTAAGTFTVSFVGIATSATGTSYENYSWTIFVPASGLHAGTSGAAHISQSKHKGTLDVYEYAPGGATSYDPAVDYETVGYETILNTYQTLIAYNQSQVGPTWQSYVPQLAACIPGSPSCQALFGSTLATNPDPTTGTFQNYTFVIDGGAQFYDASTSKNWGVYPSDVVFSIARTLAFSTLPGWEANNGWIIAQSLLPAGDATWDGAAHFPGNNTPQGTLQNMIVNGTDCPSSAMTGAYHGCVTFHAVGLGQVWPFFLELIVDPLGGSIVSCGFFSSHVSSGRPFGAPNAGIPWWTDGTLTASNDAGDHPCKLPGGATSSTDPAYISNVSAIPVDAWDNWEYQGSGTPGTFYGNVQYQGVGSGPYYMANYVPGSSYLLKANPAYAQNPQCTWTGCQPASGKYAGTVSVIWEASATPGEEAYAAGTADFAGIPTTQTALLLQLIAQGKVAALEAPSISIYFWPFNLAFDKAGASQIDTNPITVSSDIMSYNSFRQFLVHAFPYDTVNSQVSTVQGIQYLFPYGGAIPKFMANYYPTNISWPSTDPTGSASDVGSAAWWWAQATDSSNTNFYDPQLSSCSSTNPCEFPMVGENGAPNVDQMISLWSSSVNTITGGKIKIDLVDINFINLVLNSLYSPPYGNPMPIFQLGWAPDYADPTDYAGPLYAGNGTYTLSDTVWQQTNLSTFNSPSCGHAGDWGYWAIQSMTLHGIPNQCQGAAYQAMQVGMAAAAVMSPGPNRVTAYNLVEQIANGLALYIYWGQANTVVSYAPYIDPSGINTNVTIGGGNDLTWFTISGNGVW